MTMPVEFVEFMILGMVMIIIPLWRLKKQKFAFSLRTIYDWATCIVGTFLVIFMLCRFPVNEESYTIDQGFDILGTDSIAYNKEIIEDIEISPYFDESGEESYSLTITKRYNVMGIYVGTKYKLNVPYTPTEEK